MNAHLRPANSPEVAELCQAHLPLVESLARRMGYLLGRLEQLDELVSAGREGLLDAARRYDASRGRSFAGYATYRIKGAMLDAARGNSELPMRTYQQLAAVAASHHASLGFGKKPSAETGQDVEDAQQERLSAAMTAAAVALLAERARQEVAEQREPVPNPEEVSSQAELLELVHQALDSLSPQEQVILRCHYFEEKSLAEAGRAASLSRSWTLRLHARALGRVKRIITRNS